MAIDREIQAVIEKHVERAVSEVALEVAALIQARVAGAIGIGIGSSRRPGRPRKNAPRLPGQARQAATQARGVAPRVAKVRAPGGGRGCIAPNCKNPSKGPRFHFLCENHRKAPKAKWSKWAEARAAERKKKAA
jgi:hypothetical protein